MYVVVCDFKSSRAERSMLAIACFGAYHHAEVDDGKAVQAHVEKSQEPENLRGW